MSEDQSLVRRFRALPILRQIAAGGAALIIIVICYGIWHHKVSESGWRAGWRDAIAAIARGDPKAISAAQASRACHNSGGVWVSSRCIARGLRS